MAARAFLPYADPRLHRPAARNPLAHPALAAPGRAGLSPEASVTKGRE